MPDNESSDVRDHGNSLCVVVTEALFILLPFVVIAIVLSSRGQLSRFAYRPEWAIAAAILSGLSLVRFAAGLLQGNVANSGLSWERVMLIFSLVVVFAFVPSLLVLSLVLVSGAASQYVALAQIGLFVLALFLFVALGWLGQQFLEDARTTSPARELKVINSSRAVGE